MKVNKNLNIGLRFASGFLLICLVAAVIVLISTGRENSSLLLFVLLLLSLITAIAIAFFLFVSARVPSHGERAEESLREANERLQAIIDNTTAVIYLKGTDGKYLLVNKRYENLFHLTKSEVTGKSDYDFFPVEVADRLVQNDNEVLLSKKPIEFEESVPSDGEMHTYISIKFPVFGINEIPYGVCGISTDITELKKNKEDEIRAERDKLAETNKQLLSEMQNRAQTQEELKDSHDQLGVLFDTLRDSEERFRKVFEEGPLGMLITDMDYRIIRANKSFCKMSGYTEDELKQISVYDLTHPDDIDNTVYLQKQLEQKLLSFYKMEKRYIRKNGEVFWISLTASFVGDKDGNNLYAIGMIEDITLRKKMENDLLQYQNILEEKVRDRTLELTLTNKMLHLEIQMRKDIEEELHRLASTMISSREEERVTISREMHDELGQILAKQKIDIAMLLSDIAASKSNDALVARVAYISKSVDILFGRIKRIAEDLRPVELDNLGLIPAITAYVSDFQERTGISTVFICDEKKLKPGTEKEISIFRIIQESLTNIIRHSNATKCFVVMKCAHGMLRLSIKDNGKGIRDSDIIDPKSFGISGIKERAYMVGGSIVIRGLNYRGTIIKAFIPMGEPGGD
jgi:PAS domain S-box-containing protein